MNFSSASCMQSVLYHSPPEYSGVQQNITSITEEHGGKQRERYFNSMARAPIFTIGHSSHSWEKFVGLLQQHGITDVVDLRTTPGSDFCPHFNKDVLQTGLRAAGIRYEHFGKALGARRTE